MTRVKQEPVDDIFSSPLTTEPVSPANQNVKEEPVDDEFSFQTLTNEAASPADQDVKQEPVDDEFSVQTLTTEVASPANQNVKEEPVDDEFSFQTLTNEAASPADQGVKQEPGTPSISLAETVAALQENSVFFIEQEAEETQSGTSIVEGKHQLHIRVVMKVVLHTNLLNFTSLTHILKMF